MRTTEQIYNIKKNISDPISYRNFLNRDQVDYLISLFEKDDEIESPYSDKVHKNTGPITLDLYRYYDDVVVSKILRDLTTIIGNYEITAAFFFKTDYPHVIHNDDTYELPNTVYKAITLPLKVYPEKISECPKLCFFDQFYFQGPAKFFHSDKDIPTFYNKQIYNYSEVENLSDKKFDKDIYEKYFTHTKLKWFEGLSLHSVLDWIPGNALIFDSVRLHCASDFRKLGIKEKLGISIFTKKSL
jgi:hypothetical protein